MPPIRKLSDKASVTGWIEPEDFAKIREFGFDAVVNFRPDHETRGQATSDEVQEAAEAAGLKYTHIPVTKHDLFTEEVVTAGAEAYAKGRNVLGFCAGGPRAAIVWAAASARTHPVDQILSVLKSAGFDLSFIRDDLEAQADRSRWSKTKVGEARETDAIHANEVRAPA